MPRQLNLTLRIFLGTALVVVLIIGVTLAIAAQSASSAANEAVDRALESARAAVSARLEGELGSLRRTAGIFVANPQFRTLVRSRDLRSVLDQSDVAEKEIGATWVQITDADGVRMAKSDEQGARADTLAESPLIGGALQGDTLSAFGISGDTSLALVVALPIEGAAEGSTVGTLMVAKLVDSVLAAGIRAQAPVGVDVVFSLLGRDDAPLVSASTLGGGPDVVAALRSFHGRAGDTASHSRIEASIHGVHYVGFGEVLRSAGGGVLGGFLMLRNRDAEFASFSRLQQTLLLSGAIGILVAAFLAFLLAREITRPIGELVQATRRATEGDYSAEIPATGDDEIGVLASAFRGMLGDLREKQQLVEFLSTSDEARTVQLSAISLTAQHRIAAAGGLVPGSRFAGRYDVKEILGEGGMGTVFKAVDADLGEVIAIKTLKKEFLTSEPSALERFKSEIRLARRISHRNVVRTHDLGENSGVYYITMEYVEGKSLKALIRAHGQLPLPIVLSVGRQLARALEVAHEQGIIHRDIKPQNMVVEPNGVLKVMDFGIARLATRTPESGVTQAGMIVGTPEYIAPEQLTGVDVDHRADIYAAGCVLYECLIGRPPITAETSYQLVTRLLEEVPVSPRSINPEVPPALDVLILSALAKDPAARPQTALILHDGLAQIG